MKTQFKSERVLPTVPGLALVADSTQGPLPLPQYSVKTLEELGANLPVGVLSNGVRVRPFRVRPFKLKQEKALAQLRDDIKGAAIGKFVTEALAMMIQTLGPHNFDAMKDGERQLIINQLTMPDVLYLYIYLRYNSLKNEPVGMTIRCKGCQGEYKWYGDLSSMEIKVVTDDTGDLTRDYELHVPMQVRGKMANKLKLGLIKWDSFCRPEFTNKGSASAQSAAIQTSIVGIDAIDAAPGTLLLTETDLDDMDKYDMSGLINDIEVHTPGPQMDITPECPTCKTQQRMMLDWSWDSFFARSARPSNPTS